MSLRSPIRIFKKRGNKRQTVPAVEPVDLQDLKDQLNITDTDKDKLLSTLIAESREEIEQMSGLALITQTWKLTMDSWPGGREPWWDGVHEGAMNMLHPEVHNWDIEIPVYPLISVDTINVYDTAGASTAVVIADTFVVDVNSQRGRITLKTGATWPIATRRNNAIEINYTAGFGAAFGDVPAPLRRAVRSMAAYLFNHRGDGCTENEAYSNSGARMSVNAYTIGRL